MGQMVDQTLEIRGRTDDVKKLLDGLEVLREKHAKGIENSVTWMCERPAVTGGITEFSIWSEKWMFREDISEMLLHTTNVHKSLVVRVYSVTDDGDSCSWVEEFKAGKSDQVAGWDASLAVSEMQKLLSLPDGPSGDMTIAEILAAPDYDSDNPWVISARAAVFTELLCDKTRGGGGDMAALKLATASIADLAAVFEDDDENGTLAELATRLHAEVERIELETITGPASTTKRRRRVNV